MNTVQLIAHLLSLWAHNPTDHHIWLAYFRHEQPGMPATWYAHYVTYCIHHWPWQMRHIIQGRPSSL